MKRTIKAALALGIALSAALVLGGTTASRKGGDIPEIPGKIVYIKCPERSSLGNVWVAEANGENQRQLTTTGDCDGATWSPDETRITYLRNGDIWGGIGNIWIVNADGTNHRQLTTSGDCTEWDMSPDEKEILYIRWIYPNEEAESGFFEGGYLWCYDLSTGSASRVFPEQEYMSAKWSPNGDCFGFLREFPPYGDWTRAKLEAYYPASQEHKTLLQEVFNCSIKWSPDGRKLYYYGSDGIGFVDLSNLSISQVVYDKDSCSDEDYIANLQFIDERSLAFSESNQEDYQMGEQYYVTTILDLETRKSTRLPLLDVCFLGDAEMYWLINEWDESSLYGWTDIMKLVVNGDTINEIDGGHDVSWIPGGKEDGADQPS